MEKAEKKCAICGVEFGLLGGSILADGHELCTDCVSSAGLSIKEIFKINEMTLDDIKSRIGNGDSNFNITKRIGKIVWFDNDNRKWIIPSKSTYDYEDIVSFELLEDGETITSGGLGRAVVGGALFGGTGAIVGAVTGGKKTKGTCNNLKIKVTLNSMETPTTYIDFITKKTKKKSKEYLVAYEQVQECLSVFQLICDERNKTTETAPQKLDSADEILKYKNLLDVGAITEEEYNLKKKELLGL